MKNDKKTKIPGILIVLILAVLVGFSGFTLVAARMISPGFDMVKLNLATLTSIFEGGESSPEEAEALSDNFTAQDDVFTEDNVDIAYGPVFDNELEAVSTPDSFVKPTPSATVIPSSSPEASEGPATPTPNATASAPLPKSDICSLPISYRVGIINWQFEDAGLDRKKLQELSKYAESQWESVIGADLLKYNNLEISKNLIHFTPDFPLIVGSYEAGQFGMTKKYSLNKNTAVREFETEISAGILYYAKSQAVYGEDPDGSKTTEAAVTRVILHQMGHILGLDHLPVGEVGVMSASWTAGAGKIELSEADKNAIRARCN